MAVPNVLHAILITGATVYIKKKLSPVLLNTGYMSSYTELNDTIQYIGDYS